MLPRRSAEDTAFIPLWFISTLSVSHKSLFNCDFIIEDVDSICQQAEKILRDAQRILKSTLCFFCFLQGIEIEKTDEGQNRPLFLAVHKSYL